jgi:hypothetical protein
LYSPQPLKTKPATQEEERMKPGLENPQIARNKNRQQRKPDLKKSKGSIALK